jgi:hypothetical protein
MGKILHPFEGTTCVSTWLQAMEYLEKKTTACNIILGIESPTRLPAEDYRVQEHVNQFFARYGALPINTVATTIFPASDYLHGGAQAVYEEFPKTFDKIREGWGTYAMRLLTKSLPTSDGKSFQSPLQQLVSKMKRQRETSRMRSVYEASLIEDDDLLTDIPIYRAPSDAKHIRGRYLPCLSHLSFKLLPNDTVVLTATYRYHYYVQRALGNLLGLAQLLAFVASEVGVEPGPLVCHSTYAALDTDGGWTANDVQRLIAECKGLATEQVA